MFCQKKKKYHIHVCWQWNSFDLQVFSISSSSEHKKPLTMMDESYLRKEGKYKHQSEIFTKKNVQVRSGYVKINKLIRCWPIPYKLFAGMRLLSSSNQDISPPLSRLNIVALGMPVIKIADRLYLLAFINSARNVLWNKSFFPPPRHLTFTRWVRCSVSDGIGIS